MLPRVPDIYQDIHQETKENIDLIFIRIASEGIWLSETMTIT
jgi:hypothetical protein